MPDNCFEAEIIRLRLPSFMFARHGHIGAARRRSELSSRWQTALGGFDLGRFTWTTFNDEQHPRAIGMRLTGLLTRGQTFEIAEWYAPDRITRGHWRLGPFGRWSELIDTERN